jgi:DNA (cytosine-5)-methyltransferase 1
MSGAIEGTREGRALYNENDAAAAHILQYMIDNGVIAPGVVTTKSIKELTPDDVIGFTQCHFFAGGGLWSVAARLAGWPDYERIWTGSCPCQPFSAAGKGGGEDDPRHLWPDFHRLIGAARPPVIMGEQVAGAAGYGWFDGVRADLAREGFAGRTVDFPACSVDAPHQRNRQYWAAGNMEYTPSVGWGEGWPEPVVFSGRAASSGADASGVTQGDAFGSGLEGQHRNGNIIRGSQPTGSITPSDGGNSLSSNSTFAVVQRQPPAGDQQNAGKDEGLYASNHLANGSGQSGISGRPGETRRSQDPYDRGTRAVSRREPADAHGGRNGTYWSGAEWIVCHDDKARRTQSGLRFLVDGLPGRIHLWRVGGNAIVPEAAKEVIAAFIDVYGLPSEWRQAA